MSALSEACARAEARWAAMSDERKTDDRMYLLILQEELRRASDRSPQGGNQHGFRSRERGR